MLQRNEFLKSHALVLVLATCLSATTALAQTTTSPLDISLEMSKLVLLPEETQTILMVTLKGLAGADTQRSPVSLAVVIDTSGSMGGPRIVHARAAAGALIERLHEGDLLTLITYDNSAEVLLANHVITSDRSTAFRTVERIQPRGSTCISCGLQAAYSILSDSSFDYTRRVVMLSDGHANMGLTDTAGLSRLASQALEMWNTPTSTIGLGLGYNESIMTGVANGGNGNYYFMEDGNTMAAVLDREFAELQTVVAERITVRITPNRGASFGAVDSPGVALEGNQLVMRTSQLSAGGERQVLLTVNLPSGELGEVLDASVSYFDGAGSQHTMTRRATLSRTSDRSASEASVNPDVVVRYEDLRAARDIERALATYQQGNREEAQQILQNSQQRLQTTAAQHDARQLESQAGEVQILMDYLGSEGSMEAGRVDGLRRHNAARSRERSQRGGGSAPTSASRSSGASSAAPASEAYYDSILY